LKLSVELYQSHEREQDQSIEKMLRELTKMIQGNLGEELDYLCGNCGHLLAENVSQGEISIDIVFKCPNCQAYNESYNVEPRPIT
jgi:rubrerythrin